MSLPWLEVEPVGFPPTEQALSEPNGLLAAGGALNADWLLCAYRLGIFPWYEAGQPLLWWSPDPRLVLQPDQLRISKSLRKLLKKHAYVLSFDEDFTAVVQHCAAVRQGTTGTWITDDMCAAYSQLHELGLAHSLEIRASGKLVGGLYGIALGKVFFGESMFSLEPNTSKLALVYLVRHLLHWGFKLIDCQVSSDHLVSMGATEISRQGFEQKLQELIVENNPPGRWQVQAELVVIGHEIEQQAN
jgi:leucyl/phenylalanyl-tRNA--protein transferase